MLAPIIFYLIASLLFPDQDEAEPITHWQIFFRSQPRDLSTLCARFPDRSDRHRPQGLRTFSRARAILRRDDDNVVRSLDRCRVYQTKAVPWLVFRNFPDLQPGFRRHAADHRSRRTRRQIDSIILAKLSPRFFSVADHFATNAARI
jgi:hypothetical protein